VDADEGGQGHQIAESKAQSAKSGKRNGRNLMKRASIVFTLSTMLFALSYSASAQQTGKVFRIGFLDPSNASGSAILLDGFRQELRKLGWIEGENITIEYRFAEQKNERLPEQ
jgi:putative tryptophan/tyrosine transport system substrate-binding protein